MADSNHRGEVVFEDVTRAVKTRKTEEIILHHCSFVVESGKLTVLIGPSDAAKQQSSTWSPGMKHRIAARC